ncbi:MAG: IS982 family transposase [Acidobacteria bacterium]|nr:IS982 family transposase [Acidobacteriota bacterium]
MVSIKEHLTILYVFVDDYLKQHPEQAGWRESNHKEPKFSDAEVITIALMQGYFNTPKLKRTYELVKANDSSAFPYLCSYKQWVARLHALAPIVGQLLRAVPVALSELDDLYLMDSQPIPICQPIRHGRVRLLREDGAYFGKTQKGWFFGFKLHALVTSEGHILGALLTPGNWDDRDGGRVLAQFPASEAVCLADLGYSGEEFTAELLSEDGLLVLTRAEVASKDQRALHSSVRERVESVFAELWQRFVTRNYSRSWHGLWNTIKLKMLEYNLCHAGIIPA